MDGDVGDYVRNYYGVSVYRDDRVRVNGSPGVISGFDQQYLLVRFDGLPEPVRVHPTWRVEVLDARVRCGL